MEVDSIVVVEIVHGEVELGVAVAEDDLIYNQTVELLVGSGLETGDGEGVEDLGIEAKVEARERQRVGCLGERSSGHSESNDARGNTVNVGDGAGRRLRKDLCSQQQADDEAC